MVLIILPARSRLACLQFEDLLRNPRPSNATPNRSTAFDEISIPPRSGLPHAESEGHPEEARTASPETITVVTAMWR